MENLAHNEESLYREIKNKAHAEGAYTLEAWNDLVEQVVEEHRSVGEFHDDEELVELVETLQSRWTDFETEIPVPGSRGGGE